MTENVLAQSSSDRHLSSDHAYPVSVGEVVAAKRKTRVQKPEVHYQLGATQRQSVRTAPTESPTPSSSEQPQVVIQQPPVHVLPIDQHSLLLPPPAVPANQGNLDNLDNQNNVDNSSSDDDDDLR